MKHSDKETEDRILEAAFSVFLKKGRTGARMQEIAETVGVNKALLHYYYRSKDNLYREVLKQTVRNYIYPIFQNLDFSKPFKDFLHSLVESQIQLIKKEMQVFKFFFSEIWMNTEEVMGIFIEVMKYGDNPVPFAMMSKITEAVRKREIREINPAEFFINVLSLDIFFFIISPMVFGLTDLSEEQKNILIENRENDVFDFIWESIKWRDPA